MYGFGLWAWGLGVWVGVWGLRVSGLPARVWGYHPPSVRIWGILGSFNNIAKAIFYLLTGDYKGLWLWD